MTNAPISDKQGRQADSGQVKVGHDNSSLEITPEMLDAGLAALNASGFLYYETENRLLVLQVLSAALGAGNILVKSGEGQYQAPENPSTIP